MQRHIPAAELSKNQHLRDFSRRSIFDFSTVSVKSGPEDPETGLLKYP
jgi:hypothetical protein